MLQYDFHHKTVSVIGVGISNTPVISFFLSHGAAVTARDRKPFEQLPAEAQALKKKGVRFICGDSYLDGINEDIICKAPGIRSDHPKLREAVSRGSLLTSEMELFFELCPCRIVGITGSDGKTTTTTLTYLALSEKFGKDKVYVGGNIGRPLLPLVEAMHADDLAVVELSSFQLHAMHRSPDIAVITNVAPNHLDWHTGMEEYTESKKNIFRFQKPGSRLVLNAANETTRAMANAAKPGTEVVMFGGDGEVCEHDGFVWYGDEKIFETEKVLLPGHHNIENYMAMTAAVYPLVGKEIIARLAETFGGVEHRCELVREFDGVRYYNSSIDSSPTRTIAALSAFRQKVIVIMGGYDKHIPFDPLGKPVCEKAKAVILTGATAGKIREAITSCPDYRENAPVLVNASDLHDAVLRAKEIAAPGDVVLLSPACASFDAFPNFEVRGRAFKELVQSFV